MDAQRDDLFEMYQKLLDGAPPEQVLFAASGLRQIPGVSLEWQKIADECPADCVILITKQGWRYVRPEDCP